MFKYFLYFVIGAAFVLILVLWIARTGDRRYVDRLWASIEKAGDGSIYTEEEIRDLPEPVQRYFRHALAPNTPIPASAVLAIRGKIRTAVETPWMPLTSQELITPREGFVWKAEMHRGSMVLHGADHYVRGEGRMRIALLGWLPFVNEGGPELSRSAMGRLVLESIWIPTSLLPRFGVEWQAKSESGVPAHWEQDGHDAALALWIDADGRVEKAAVQRYGRDGERVAVIPFGMTALAEQTFGGLTIPSEASAGWWFDTPRYAETMWFAVDAVEYR